LQGNLPTRIPSAISLLSSKPAGLTAAVRSKQGAVAIVRGMRQPEEKKEGGRRNDSQTTDLVQAEPADQIANMHGTAKN